MGPLSRDELAGVIAAGEDSFTEFKDPRTTNEDVAKELCAFANAAGGRVLIGVDDEGVILNADGWDEERVMNIARTTIDPAIIPSYQRLQWDDERTVVIVGIEQGVEKPYAWRRGQEARRYFIRVGSTSREATREELIRLTQASGAVESDLRPVPGASLDDLADERLSERFAGLRSIRYGELSDEERRQVLVDAEILHETGPPTIGGLLCYGREPERRLPYAMVSGVAYRGTVVERELLDRAEIGGRVEEQVEAGASFVERNLRAPSNVEGLERNERPRPSLETIREVVANAVCHRHYGIAGPVHVRVFADRVEVQSPGAPPNGVSPEAMRVGVSVRRNEFILQHLVRLRLVDAVGRGVVLMYEEAIELGLEEPEIVAGDAWTRVTLYLTRIESVA